MKARPTIGIISPGDMGHAIGTVLVQHSLRVLTNLQGRSARTVALARQAGSPMSAMMKPWCARPTCSSPCWFPLRLTRSLNE